MRNDIHAPPLETPADTEVRTDHPKHHPEGADHHAAAPHHSAVHREVDRRAAPGHLDTLKDDTLKTEPVADVTLYDQPATFRASESNLALTVFVLMGALLILVALLAWLM